jgi:hypothetical protein
VFFWLREQKVWDIIYQLICKGREEGVILRKNI